MEKTIAFDEELITTILQNHARSKPAEEGYTTEEFDWRNKIKALKGKTLPYESGNEFILILFQERSEKYKAILKNSILIDKAFIPQFARKIYNAIEDFDLTKKYKKYVSENDTYYLIELIAHHSGKIKYSKTQMEKEEFEANLKEEELIPLEQFSREVNSVYQEYKDYLQNQLQLQNLF